MTKKKVKVDQTARVAKFNEKLTLETSLIKDTSNKESNKYNSFNVHLRLLAYYNNKEKAIGIVSFDLASYVNNKDLLIKNGGIIKLNFEKCFDKQATISFSLKYKE